MTDSWLVEYMDSHPDFPIKGINYISYRRLLSSPKVFDECISTLASMCESLDVTTIAAIDSRGFIFGAPLALRLSKKLVLIRKPGKLPNPIRTKSLAMEYADVSLEIEDGSITPDEKVVIVDDIIATGNTLNLACDLVHKCDANVAGILSLAKLSDVECSSSLNNFDVKYIISI